MIRSDWVQDGYSSYYDGVCACKMHSSTSLFPFAFALKLLWSTPVWRVPSLHMPHGLRNITGYIHLSSIVRWGEFWRFGIRGGWGFVSLDTQLEPILFKSPQQVFHMGHVESLAILRARGRVWQLVHHGFVVDGTRGLGASGYLLEGLEDAAAAVARTSPTDACPSTPFSGMRWRAPGGTFRLFEPQGHFSTFRAPGPLFDFSVCGGLGRCPGPHGILCPAKPHR